MKLGIVGLPNVGKSTLFNSLTKAGAESANYPFCTIDPNVGIVAVPDERLDKLAALYNSAKITPAVIEFVDIAGLVKGASKGEGLGNQFLANIREVDAIVHVVRCFEDSNIVHVDGSVNPVRDIETINLELIFSDMEVLERRLAKQKRASYNNKDIAKECDLIERLLKFLEAGNLAKNFECEDEDEEADHAEGLGGRSAAEMKTGARRGRKRAPSALDARSSTRRGSLNQGGPRVHPPLREPDQPRSARKARRPG